MGEIWTKKCEGGDVVEEAGVEILDGLQLACPGLGRGRCCVPMD